MWSRVVAAGGGRAAPVGKTQVYEWLAAMRADGPRAMPRSRRPLVSPAPGRCAIEDETCAGEGQAAVGSEEDRAMLAATGGRRCRRCRRCTGAGAPRAGRARAGGATAGGWRGSCGRAERSVACRCHPACVGQRAGVLGRGPGR